MNEIPIITDRTYAFARRLIIVTFNQQFTGSHEDKHLEEKLTEELKETAPSHVKLITHFEALPIWDYFQIEEKKITAKKEILKNKTDITKIQEIFDQYADRLTKIVTDRAVHLRPSG